MDTLLESSDAMRNEATSFHRSTNQVKDRMQWKNLKMKLLIALLFIGLILIIVVPLILNRAPSSSATAGNKS